MATMAHTNGMGIIKKIENKLNEHGYECAPFLAGWYNESVDKRFRLPYEEDVLTVSVISSPEMFEKGFLPFVEFSRQRLSETLQDPLDQCTRHYFKAVQDELQLSCNLRCDIICDYDTLPTGQPRCLVQTAGHVSGQARYYQRCDIEETDEISWSPRQKIFGACAHPRYGGWFGFRGVLLLPDIRVPDLPRAEPPDVLPSNELRHRFLDLFTYHWKDGRFRDVPPSVEARYSEQQVKYFKTPPGERHLLLGLPKPRSYYDMSDDEDEDDDAGDITDKDDDAASQNKTSVADSITEAHG